MLTVLLYTVSVLWATIAIIALILCDVSARREARMAVIETRRPSRRRTSRVAIGAPGS